MTKEEQLIDYIRTRLEMWEGDAPVLASDWREGYHNGMQAVAKEFRLIFEQLNIPYERKALTFDNKAV